MSNYFLDLFAKYPEAEGIDFIPFSEAFSNFSLGLFGEVIQSNWREDFIYNENLSIPKTPYRLWKMKDSKKVYIEIGG